MLKIITNTGIELDIKPDTTIEFEMENPLFQNEYIPTTFSTSITLPVSPNNIKTLGYLAAMKMPPAVKEIAVTIQLDGTELVTGLLEYESINDSGELEYIFTGKSPGDEWEEKIYNYKPTVATLINFVKTNGTGYSGIEKGNAKYSNERQPVYLFSSILEKIPNLTFEDTGSLAIAGNYKYKSTYPYKYEEALPEMTALEFLTNVARMLCMAVFRDGNGYKAKYIQNIINEGDAIDWSNKISDVFESTTEKAKGYRFKYADEEDSNTIAKGDAETQSQITTVSLIESMLAQSETSEYKTFRISALKGEVFSIKGKESVPVPLSYATVYDYLIDTILHVNNEVVVGGGETDMSTGFTLVRCIPTQKIYSTQTSSASTTMVMTPIIDVLSEDEDRPVVAFVGLLRNGQLVDKGVTGNGQESFDFCQSDSFDYNGVSWDGQRVFNRHHAEFANYLNKDKQVISAEVNLNTSEINSFRLWQKVEFANKKWFVRKLTIDISAKHGIVSTKAEFIEA